MMPHTHASGVAAIPPASFSHVQPQVDGQHHINGYRGGQNVSNGRLPHRRKLLDADRALQYSPFSSVVPFSPDVIPMPNAHLPGFSSVFANTSEQLAARQQLEQLNQELAKNPGSNAARGIEAELKSLLDPDDVSDFKFKSPAKIHHNAAQRKPPTGRNTHSSSRASLTPLASTMLNHVSFDHRYPTPVSPNKSSSTPKKPLATTPQELSSPAHVGKTTQVAQVVVPSWHSSSTLQSGKHSAPHQYPLSAADYVHSTQQATPVTPSPQRPYHNQSAFIQNRGIPINELSACSPPSNARLVAKAVQIPAPRATPVVNGHRSQATQSPTILSSHPTPVLQRPVPQPMVLIPPSSAEAMKSDFVTRDLASQAPVSRKRKRGFGDDTVVEVAETRDHKAAADAVVRQFCELLEDIFEADNQSPPNPEFFIPVNIEDHETTTLASTVHVKLDSFLPKVIAYGRLAEIPLDDVQRLQGLCEGAVSSTELHDFCFDSHWNSEEFESWIQRLDAVDLGLRAAKTILRTMTGGREEKQLYSEELLLSITRMGQKIVDSCLIPVVEARSSSSTANLFQSLSENRKCLSHLLQDASKVMSLLTKLLAKEDMSESVITPIEFFAVRLMFVENASSEKESVLGTQKYETMRRTAMDMISIISSRYPAQRAFLFDEILTSLQRLPTGRQAARQFKLSNGRAIQLVTALIIQLVQTSATVARSAGKSKLRKPVPRADAQTLDRSPNSIADQHDSDDEADTSDDSDDSEDSSGNTSEALRKLRKDASTLCDSSAKSAQHAIGYLMQRAQTSSKSGDQPHRQLLDIFVEDLLTVLGLPEWPGAELLLRAVCARASHIFENPKSLAPAKNMALELLGTMGSAISDLVANTRNVVRGLENQEAEYSGYLRQMFDDYADGSLEISELLLWDGPYHAVVEHLESDASEDLQNISAQAYYLAQWAKAVSFNTSKASPESEKLADRIRTMLSGGEWVTSQTLGPVTTSQSNVAYALTVLNMDFCRRFDYMLSILLDSVTSEQTTVRSRGLKSVTQMLEKDPSILDRARSVKNIILKCATDTSPMVRDAALTLIGKCITLKPALEAEFLNHVLHLSNDAAIGVRKRAMKLLKDIYLRNSSRDVRAAVCDSLLRRAKDLDPGVVDLARQMFEEMWIAPFSTIHDISNPGAQNEILLRSQILLIIRTVSRSANVPTIFVSLLKEIMSNKSKSAALNFKVCKIFVSTAFDVMIDSAQIADAPDQSQIFEALTLFAKADPRLFVSDQLQILQPYIGSINSLNDLDIFRPVVVIFRCVLPVLSSVEHGLLEVIQAALLKSVSRLFKNELSEVAQCLWTINVTLQKPEPLIKLMVSVLNILRKLEKVDLKVAESKEDLGRAKKLVQIAGYLGKYCDFESYATIFQGRIPWFKGGSVASLIVQSLQPFASQSQPLALRTASFDGTGLICQSWPFIFTQPIISKAFASVLQYGDQELQEIVLSNFRDFFANAEHQTTPKSEENGAPDASPTPKLGGSMTANERDSASALITQHFLKDILNIALSSQDMCALTATEVIASINRQGLAHPKESGPALVALETSTNTTIARVSLEEHRILHQQHESMFEREYMRAIYEAFKYQRDVVKDPLGFTAQPLVAKLNGMWDIIKTSKAKYQKKFLSNYCSKINFDPTRLANSDDMVATLQFSRFLMENIAFFDFTRLDELLHAVSCMEKFVADTGSGVAHNISTEVFHIIVVVDNQEDDNSFVKDESSASHFKLDAGECRDLPPSQNPATGYKPPIEPARLKHLTSAAVILSSLWETRTYLRRLYGQTASQQRRESGKGRPATKDLSKAPSRIQGVSGEKLVTTIADKVASLDNQEAMIKQCEEFVELLSVDNEVKINTESEESLGERPETPGLDEEDEKDTPMSGASRGMKRKGSTSAAGTPSKKRGRPPLGRKKSSKKSVESEGSDDDWQ